MNDFLFIMDGPFKGTKVYFSDILYLVTHNRYVHLITETDSYLLLKTLPQMSRKLPGRSFGRVHSRFIVYLPRITSFDLQTSHLLLESRHAAEMNMPGLLIPIDDHFNTDFCKKIR
jgi:DNA-binding LytR/AlgR family response regulator